MVLSKRCGTLFLFLGEPGRAEQFVTRAILSMLATAILLLCTPPAVALGPSDLLLLVNDDSPTSVYIADLYRRYYPEIGSDQVVHLSGLADCGGATSTPADEIVSRQLFESNIATPVRQHLLNNDMVDSTKVIVTTAGMPYRISDDAFPGIVQPAASTLYVAASDTYYLEAASVESELSVLFQIDPAGPNPLALGNRAVNPYQGYSSGFDEFDRGILDNRVNMNWRLPRPVNGTDVRPRMEGDRNSYGVKNRDFSAADMYLTCRLDGPREQGTSAIYAVHDMLERSQRASSSEYGINPTEAVAVFDDAPQGPVSNRNRLYNLEAGTDQNLYDETSPYQAPDVSLPEIRDDYDSGFARMTGQTPTDGALNSGTMDTAHGVTVLNDKRPGCRTSQSDLDPSQAIVALASFGTNGDEGGSSDYLIDDGLLFNTVYGAVFASIESFNATTMCSDVDTGFAAQGKIVDFISISDSSAIGHSFEPLADAAVDTEFLFQNLLADNDDDGFADMTFVEAAFTAIPYLSWSEVVIGDPLMQLAYGPGGIVRDEWRAGDIDGNGAVDIGDIYSVGMAYGLGLGDDFFNDLMDIDQDGMISIADIYGVGMNYGSLDDWPGLSDNLNLGSPAASPSGQPIPEPTGLLLCLAGAILTACRKRTNKNAG